MQTIGNAAASAGTHAQDGTVNGHPYCAATDISVQRTVEHADPQPAREARRASASPRGSAGPGTTAGRRREVRHIHAVYANARMKSSLRSQVRSWLVGRNGLVTNSIYEFHRWSATAKATVRHKFAQSACGTTNHGSSCVVGGLYCGGDKVSGSSSTLYRCTGSGAPSVVRHCGSGCRVNRRRRRLLPLGETSAQPRAAEQSMQVHAIDPSRARRRAHVVAVLRTSSRSR